MACRNFAGAEFKGTFLGVPIIRTILYLGLYWGLPVLGIVVHNTLGAPKF